MKRYLFLDIDGVLANEEYIVRTRLADKQGGMKSLIDPNRVRMLNGLKDLEVDVVISSSWGNYNNETAELLYELGLELNVVGQTDHFHKDWICRGVEIDKWLFEHTEYGENYGYAILDDDCDMLLKQVEHFVMVDRETALTEDDIRKLRDIFAG